MRRVLLPGPFSQITIIDRFEDFYVNVYRKMESVFESLSDSTSTTDPEKDIPKTNDPVFILGKRYNAIQGK